MTCSAASHHLTGGLCNSHARTYASVTLGMLQETEYAEQFRSMLQAAGVATNLDLVEACVSAETVNFELFKEVASMHAEAAQLQETVSQLERQAGKFRSVCACDVSDS